MTLTLDQKNAIVNALGNDSHSFRRTTELMDASPLREQFIATSKELTELARIIDEAESVKIERKEKTKC